MYSRKNHDIEPNFLPKEWSEELIELLQTVYSSYCEANQKHFEIFGLTYPDEAVIIVSLLDENKDSSLPITYLASFDISTNSDIKKVLAVLMDTVGIFFDVVFSTKDWCDYDAQWQESTVKNIDFYYRSTREDVSLSLAADQIIKNGLH